MPRQIRLVNCGTDSLDLSLNMVVVEKMKLGNRSQIAQSALVELNLDTLIFDMKKLFCVLAISMMLLQGCQTSQSVATAEPPVEVDRSEVDSAPSNEALRASIIVPSETASSPAALKAQIVVPSELASANDDIRSRIIVPSELASGTSDIRSRIVVPSEIASERPDIRSQIVVPSETAVEASDIRSRIFVPSES